jgi:dephospho-CoA kinase
MIKIGITGGIGSGKSIICEVFKKLGVPIYNADVRAKTLTNEDKQIREKLTSKFGNTLYKKNELDRGMLADIIFKDNTALTFVNSVIHPAVELDFIKWCNQYDHKAYIINEAALHFESGVNKKMDKMITVYAPADLRIKRVMMRNTMTQEEVMNRINNQLPDEEKMKRSDFVIYNDDRQGVLEQVITLHNIFIEADKRTKTQESRL